jgi:hypothetical protein
VLALAAWTAMRRLPRPAHPGPESAPSRPLPVLERAPRPVEPTATVERGSPPAPPIEWHRRPVTPSAGPPDSSVFAPLTPSPTEARLAEESAALGHALIGEVVLDVRVLGPGPRARRLEALTDQTVAAVQMRATDLLIWFQPSGLALHTPMGVRGSWSIYPREEAEHEFGWSANCMLDVDRWRAVCRAAVVCEIPHRGTGRRSSCPAGAATDAPLTAAPRSGQRPSRSANAHARP